MPFVFSTSTLLSIPPFFSCLLLSSPFPSLLPTPKPLLLFPFLVPSELPLCTTSLSALGLRRQLSCYDTVPYLIVATAGRFTSSCARTVLCRGGEGERSKYVFREAIRRLREVNIRGGGEGEKKRKREWKEKGKRGPRKGKGKGKG